MRTGAIKYVSINYYCNKVTFLWYIAGSYEKENVFYEENQPTKICANLEFVRSGESNRDGQRDKIAPLGFLRKQWYKIPFWYGALKIPGMNIIKM